jgi:hypothetical protein
MHRLIAELFLVEINTNNQKNLVYTTFLQYYNYKIFQHNMYVLQLIAECIKTWIIPIYMNLFSPLLSCKQLNLLLFLSWLL